MVSERGKFGTKIGVILATAGSAIGLGNIWRFPYIVGKGGGAAFLFIYIGCILLLGIPGMVAEFIIRRNSSDNAARPYKNLSNGKPWQIIGYMGVFTAIIIFGFYAVVAGWCMRYFFISLLGQLNGDADYIKNYFQEFFSNLWIPLFGTCVFILLTHMVVIKGVRKGIEKASNLMMPALFILLLIIVIASCSLSGAMKGVKFLFRPDFSKLNNGVMLDALGQVFFSLSLGIACLCTYASYFSRHTQLVEVGCPDSGH